jgi:hypothetical protein
MNFYLLADEMQHARRNRGADICVEHAGVKVAGHAVVPPPVQLISAGPAAPCPWR